jgi:hypothetical protein
VHDEVGCLGQEVSGFDAGNGGNGLYLGEFLCAFFVIFGYFFCYF